MLDISEERFILRKLKHCQLEVSNRSVALENLDESVYISRGLGSIVQMEWPSPKWGGSTSETHPVSGGHKNRD
jgi:hypothetical protein